MIVKLLGILDFVVAIIFYLSTTFSFIPTKLVLIAGLYLVIKGGIFSLTLDISSVIDIIAGGFILLSIIINLHWLLEFLITLYLVQKAFFSIVS